MRGRHDDVQRGALNRQAARLSMMQSVEGTQNKQNKQQQQLNRQPD
jgi:hypothetical protein